MTFLVCWYYRDLKPENILLDHKVSVEYVTECDSECVTSLNVKTTSHPVVSALEV